MVRQILWLRLLHCMAYEGLPLWVPLSCTFFSPTPFYRVSDIQSLYHEPVRFDYISVISFRSSCFF